MATSRPSRSWCWMTKASTGHWKFLSPLLREPCAEMSRDSSGDGWRSRDEPTSGEGPQGRQSWTLAALTTGSGEVDEKQSEGCLASRCLSQSTRLTAGSSWSS